tara:strand:+ start:2319 stop:2642 length:324 start_codon:yes stop_codon:yes gene_type:complete
MTTIVGTPLTETSIAIGLLIPRRVRNEDVEIIGIWNIVDGVVYYSQCELEFDDVDDLLEYGEFEGEGIYVDNKMINPLEYPEYHTLIDDEDNEDDEDDEEPIMEDNE